MDGIQLGEEVQSSMPIKDLDCDVTDEEFYIGFMLMKKPYVSLGYLTMACHEFQKRETASRASLDDPLESVWRERIIGLPSGSS